MSFLCSVLVASSVVIGLLLTIMVLLQQTSNNGIISSSTPHFAPGSVDSLKEKITATLAALFIANIVMIWVVKNRANKPSSKSLVEQVATTAESKAEKESVPTE